MSQHVIVAILALALFSGFDVVNGQERPWTSTQLPPHGMMGSIAARDRYQFWAVGENGTILHTSDGGTVWDVMRKEFATSWLYDIAYDVSCGAIAVGNGGVIVRIAHDQTMEERTVDASLTFLGVDAENQVVVIVGHDADERPVVFRSTDGGLNYQQLSVSIPNKRIVLKGVKFISISDVVLFGSVGEQNDFGSAFILVSHDAGASWEGATTPLRDMTVTGIERVGGNCVAVGFQQGESRGILRSSDNGNTWQFQEQPELGLATDIVKGDALDLIAVGMRVIGEDADVTTVVSEFTSSDGGRNWSIADIADGSALAHLARGGDKVIAVGLPRDCHRRWYDRTIQRTNVTALRKHIELGSIHVGTRREISVNDVLVNRSSSRREIVSIKLHGLIGVTVRSPKVGDFIATGNMQPVTFTHERNNEGVEWGVLTVSFDDFTSVAMYVSSLSHGGNTTPALHTVTDVIDIGEVRTTNSIVQRFDVVENRSATAVTINEVAIEGEDLLAFVLTDLPQPRFVLQPGETFSLNVQFEPLTKGIYHAVAVLKTDVGIRRIPIVASSRQDAIDDVINYGSVGIGGEAEADVFAQHFLWNTELGVVAIAKPAGPFEVTSTTPLPFIARPYDRFSASVKVSGSHSQNVASILRIPWTFGSAEPIRVERRILMAKLGNGDPTGVEDVIPGKVSAILYPQPSTTVATVNLPQDIIWSTYLVVDVQGRVVQSGAISLNTQQLRLDVSELNPGSYRVHVCSDGAVCSAPLIKQ